MAQKCSARVQLGQQGRLVIPAEIREQMGVQPGDTLVLFMEDGHLVVDTPDHMISELQEKFRRSIPPGVSLVDELIAERREEFRRELEETEAIERRARN